jgi:hypothetical protein
MPVLRAEQWNVDLGDGIGGEYDEARAGLNLSDPLFRLQHRQRALEPTAVDDLVRQR